MTNTATARIPEAITNTEDVIDSRDIIARIEYLEGELQDAQDELEAGQDETEESEEAICGSCGLTWNDAAVSSKTPTPGGRCPFEHVHEEAEELKVLRELAEEASGTPDWEYGETLIRDSYFEEYAQNLAEEIGAIDKNASWPNNCIDWEKATRELQYDYFTVEFDGVDYWVRS
jgi:hypothetical protein